MVITQQVLIGNCAEILKTLPSESVDCVVTSPPYWGLRDYKTEPLVWDGDADCEHEWGIEKRKVVQPDRDSNGTIGAAGTRGQQGYSKATSLNVSLGAFCQKCGAWRGQLGLEPTPQLYMSHLISIFNEVKRVLKKTGTCWVNLGDTYGGTTQTAKSLAQIPSRFAIAMTDSGWILRNEIIWHKPNAIPSSASDRFTVDFEKLFFFVKSKKYYFEQQFEAATDPIGKATKFGAKTLERDAFLGNPANWSDRKPYISNRRRNKRTVWSIPVGTYAGPHFAVFPPELVETPIKAGCPPGGVVLDPFGGSGTTSEVARQLGRASIIIELNPDYLELIRERARTDVPDVLGFEEVTP